METEQDKTLEAPQIAIQMEIEGKEYYLKADFKALDNLATTIVEKHKECGFA